MISIEELRKISKLKGIFNLGNTEKDYIQDIVLLSISRNTKDEMIFKGGTCLYKFYKLDRFSEYIDFTLGKEINIDRLIQKIISDLSYFEIETEIKSTKRVMNSIMITLRSKGPLYKGFPQTLSSIGIDVNLKSTIDLEPMLAKYNTFYSDIPSFSLMIMQETEILAEKIRAIISRTKARDVYDLWFLLEKGVNFDEKLIEKKLKYYKQEWDSKEFMKKLDLKKRVWEIELRPLVKSPPDFSKVKNFIMKRISK